MDPLFKNVQNKKNNQPIIYKWEQVFSFLKTEKLAPFARKSSIYGCFVSINKTLRHNNINITIKIMCAKKIV
jgi:hypothetical protein